MKISSVSAPFTLPRISLGGNCRGKRAFPEFLKIEMVTFFPALDGKKRKREDQRTDSVDAED